MSVMCYRKVVEKSVALTRHIDTNIYIYTIVSRHTVVKVYSNNSALHEIFFHRRGKLR